MVVTARYGVDIPWCDTHSGALVDGVLSFGRSGCLLLALCACNAHVAPFWRILGEGLQVFCMSGHAHVPARACDLRDHGGAAGPVFGVFVPCMCASDGSLRLRYFHAHVCEAAGVGVPVLRYLPAWHA